MSTLVTDAANVEILGRTPWPDTVRLFQPYEVGQILMSDFASCLSVKTFLNMCQLSYQTELRVNAEFMSPSGKLPFIQVGPLLVSEFEPIVAVAHAKGHNLSKDLTDEQRADMKAYMAMVTAVIGNSLLYVHWYDKETLTIVTRPRYGSVYKWPLNVLIPLKKQYEVRQLLRALGWHKKTLPEVYEEVSTCCIALSEKLADQKYFFGEEVTELDALVFGHLYTLLTTVLPSFRLAECVRQHANLVDFCTRVHDTFFKEPGQSHQ